MTYPLGSVRFNVTKNGMCHGFVFDYLKAKKRITDKAEKNSITAEELTKLCFPGLNGRIVTTDSPPLPGSIIGFKEANRVSHWMVAENSWRWHGNNNLTKFGDRITHNGAQAFDDVNDLKYDEGEKKGGWDTDGRTWKDMTGRQCTVICKSPLPQKSDEW